MYNIRFKKNSWKINVGATTMVYIDSEVKPHNEIIKNVIKKKGETQKSSGGGVVVAKG